MIVRMFDHDSPAGVEALAVAIPGPQLAATLAGIDTTQVNGHARVIVMQAWERLASWASTRMYETMAGARRPLTHVRHRLPT